jgi:hypothetical protein
MLVTQLIHAAPHVIRVTARFLPLPCVSPHHRLHDYTAFPCVTAPPYVLQPRFTASHAVDTDHPRGTACYTGHCTFCTTYQRVTVSPHLFIHIVVLVVRSTTTKPGFCPTTTRRILVDRSYPEYLIHMRILLPTPRMRSLPQGSHGKWGGL